MAGGPSVGADAAGSSEEPGHNAFWKVIRALIMPRTLHHSRRTLEEPRLAANAIAGRPSVGADAAAFSKKPGHNAIWKVVRALIMPRTLHKSRRTLEEPRLAANAIAGRPSVGADAAGSSKEPGYNAIWKLIGALIMPRTLQ
jgi:hypothetical protein